MRAFKSPRMITGLSSVSNVAIVSISLVNGSIAANDCQGACSGRIYVFKKKVLPHSSTMQSGPLRSLRSFVGVSSLMRARTPPQGFLKSCVVRRGMERA